MELAEERHAYVFTEEQRLKLKMLNKDFKAWFGVENVFLTGSEDPPPEKAIPLMPERGASTLRYVDLYEDEGVWCIVDEGANSNTHSDHWMQNAIEKWAPQGARPAIKDTTITSFTGVGSKASTGSFRFPCGLRLKESGLILHRNIVSHQMPD